MYKKILMSLSIAATLMMPVSALATTATDLTTDTQTETVTTEQTDNTLNTTNTTETVDGEITEETEDVETEETESGTKPPFQEEEDLDKRVKKPDEEYIPDSEKYKTSAEAAIEEGLNEEAEEVEMPEKNIFGGYDTYQEWLEATKQTELTPEQEAAGMKLNEYGQVVDPSEGEKYSEVIFGGVNPGRNTGYVDIQLQTDCDLHEEIYVHVMNMNTFKIYGCYLYEINGYSTQMCLPAGNYIVHEAAPSLDMKGRFYTYNRQFTVVRDATQILTVTLMDREALVDPDATATTETDEANAEASLENVIEPENIQPIQEVNNDNLVEKPKISILSAIFGIAVIAGLFYALYKIFPPRPKKEFRGFDE